MIDIVLFILNIILSTTAEAWHKQEGIKIKKKQLDTPSSEIRKQKDKV